MEMSKSIPKWFNSRSARLYDLDDLFKYFWPGSVYTVQLCCIVYGGLKNEINKNK